MIVQRSPMEIIRARQTQYPVDVVSLAEDFGIKSYRGELPESISWKIWRDPAQGGSAGYAASFRHDLPDKVARFGCARAIAHVIRHKGLIDHLTAIVESSTFQSGLGQVEDTFLNILAMEILAPHHIVVALQRMGFSSPGELSDKLQVGEHLLGWWLRRAWSDPIAEVMTKQRGA